MRIHTHITSVIPFKALSLLYLNSACVSVSYWWQHAILYNTLVVAIELGHLILFILTI